MKFILVLSLVFILAACGETVADPVVVPSVPEVNTPEVVEESVVEPVEDPVEEESVEEESVIEDEETVTETVDEESVEEETTQSTVFNAQTLANYDGREGRPAYIAIDGIVYDVTGHPMWPNGLHRGSFQAGKDYSAQIPASHRRDMRYDEFPVGTYE